VSPDPHHRVRLPDPEERPTLTVEETAAILQVGRNTVYDAVRSGAVPSIRVGRRYLVPTAQLAVMLGLRKEPNPASAIAAETQPPQSQPARNVLPT
jgi:excisionase family DNA binding protein